MDTQTRPLTISAQVWTGAQEFQALELPPPELGPGEALANIDLATVCGSDMHTVSGRRPGPFPAILGHEAVGRIAATGAGSVRDYLGRELAVGDRVVWSVTVYCGHCDRCKAGMSAKCRTLLKTGHEPLNSGWALSGGYASHIHLLRGITLVSVPDELSDLAVAPSAYAAAQSRVPRRWRSATSSPNASHWPAGSAPPAPATRVITPTVPRSMSLWNFPAHNPRLPPHWRPSTPAARWCWPGLCPRDPPSRWTPNAWFGASSPSQACTIVNPFTFSKR